MPRQPSQRRRIVRKQCPLPMTASSKADVKTCLRSDFDHRCAYCMSHEHLIGERHFDIEHFCPVSAGGGNDYDNLFWSCKTCNGFKWTEWPGEAQRRRGARYANPCREWDYGEHLIELPDGTLEGLTRCGEYHLEKIFLNRPELVEWRADRTRIKELVTACKKEIQKRRRAGESAGSLATFASAVQEHERQLAISIPPIPRRRKRRGRE
jgi:hypothetical protein